MQLAKYVLQGPTSKKAGALKDRSDSEVCLKSLLPSLFELSLEGASLMTIWHAQLSKKQGFVEEQKWLYLMIFLQTLCKLRCKRATV